MDKRALGAAQGQIEIAVPEGGAEPGAFAWVREVHTLGPRGTNCERAASAWAARHSPGARIVLHASMEGAAEETAGRDHEVMLGAIAYPKLHSIIYEHVRDLRLIDLFIMDTDEMVLAARQPCAETPRICATHPAPEPLLPRSVTRQYVASTALAAETCATGLAEGCVTTLGAARRFGLHILRRYGPIPMGFTIHGPARPAAHCRRDQI